MLTLNRIKSYVHVLVVVVALATISIDYIDMTFHMYEVFNLPTEILSAKKPNWHENIWLTQTIVFSFLAIIGTMIYFLVNFETHYKKVKSDFESFMSNREKKKSSVSDRTPKTF